MVKVLIFIITLSTFLIIYFVTKKFSKKSFYLNLTLVLFIFLGLVAFFLNNKIETKKSYYPPTFDGEVVIPGYFDEN